MPQSLPCVEVRLPRDGGELLIMSNQDAFDRRQFLIEQQAVLPSVHTRDTRTEGQLCAAIGVELDPDRCCLLQVKRQIDDAHEATHMIEVTVAGMYRRQCQMVLERKRPDFLVRQRHQQVFFQPRTTVSLCL
ncbi:hypothetical protein WK62_23540 [Burkholderia ubonensis]|nr:hypothetical protein WK62_23540 [Burkholderia ubonensis]